MIIYNNEYNDQFQISYLHIFKKHQNPELIKKFTRL